MEEKIFYVKGKGLVGSYLAIALAFSPCGIYSMVYLNAVRGILAFLDITKWNTSS
jgi:hypothetical protein